MDLKFKILLGLSLILILLGLTACPDDSDGPSDNFFRYLYYPAATEGGAAAGETGLFRVNLKDDMSSRLVESSVVYTSDVAENGVMVFEYGGDIQNRFWGICEDGSIIPVPFPETSPEWINVSYENEPTINVSYDGHHAAYFVRKTPVETIGPEDLRPYLIVFNCSNGQMKQVSLYDFIIDEFAEIQANSGFPYGSFVILDYDGTNVWFVLRAVRFEDEVIAEEAYCGVRWNLTEGLERFTDIMDKPFELMSRNSVTKNFIVKSTDSLDGQFVQSLDGTGEFWNNALSVSQLGSPSQMAEERAEIAVMSGWGIELLHPNTGGNLVRIKSYDDIDPNGKYRHEPNPRISVSPDGQMLTFALEHISDPGRFTIFTIDREGKDLKIIYEDVSSGIPKISGELKEN